jgi:hypothetical protein
MSVGELTTCAYDECGVQFVKIAHNQKYHTDICCKLATSKKAMQNYYERKARKNGKVRICAGTMCHTKLSRYNEGKYCSQCEESYIHIYEDELKQKITDLIP